MSDWPIFNGQQILGQISRGKKLSCCRERTTLCAIEYFAKLLKVFRNDRHLATWQTALCITIHTRHMVNLWGFLYRDFFKYKGALRDTRAKTNSVLTEPSTTQTSTKHLIQKYTLSKTSTFTNLKPCFHAGHTLLEQIRWSTRAKLVFWTLQL